MSWKSELKSELDEYTKDELIDRIIKQRAKTYSEVGKRNVATSKCHERRCKKLLTDWSGVDFRRRRIEGRGDDVSVVEGVADIIPVHGKILFAIESKKGEGFSFDALLTNPHTAKFTKWWHQVNYDARLLTEKTGEKKWPMLFFKPIPAWDWVAVPIECFKQHILKPTNVQDNDGECWFQHLKYDMYGTIGKIAHDISSSGKNKVIVELELESCIICKWKTFAAEVCPKSIFV